MALLAAALTGGVGAGPAMAVGADPDAPAGAAPSWLPKEAWVDEHWLPYDETRLERRLGMSHAELRRWLSTSPRPLTVLIRQKGLDARRLAVQLVAPSRGRVSRATYRLLLEHTIRTFTQQHLADHLYGHLFHQASWQRHAGAIFGGSNREVNRRHADGESLADIGAASGRSLDDLVRRMSRYLTAAAQEGIRTGQTPAVQARRWYARQRAALPEWLSRRRDPAHPGHVDNASGGPAARARARAAAGALPVFGPLCRLP